MDTNQPTTQNPLEKLSGRLVRISVDVPFEICTYREQHHMKWRQLLHLGVLYNEQMPPLRDRIANQEKNISIMQKRITSMSERIYELEGVDHAAVPK